MAPTSRTTHIRDRDGALFTRWFWLVYFPLGLLGMMTTLWITGLLPKTGHLVVLVLGIYSIPATRLLYERRRAGLSVRPGKGLMKGLTALAMMVLAGSVLFGSGWHELRSSGGGLMMLTTGAFLLLLAAVAPAFKLLDVAIREVARMVKR